MRYLICGAPKQNESPGGDVTSSPASGKLRPEP
jgi:hypothetical protein